ncbi:uroporphyrinogen-III synthase [Martelella sp. HB161492]|uniref:uroporphyrinogen-III synthase n=1 Tax=Martelella sp. HB161492 TaxID=2720726 RepID=UPI00159108EA|nr:uroporphyrinogen-III synthase [Martelella sp. HB161492]
MRVLLTRPERRAQPSLARLEAAGHAAENIALTYPQHDPAAVCAALDTDFTALAVTSSEAVQALVLAEVNRDILSRPLFAVGDTTAAAAGQAGFHRIISGPGDGLGLAETVIASGLVARDGPALLYLAGEPHAKTFEAALAQAGLQTTTVIAYRMMPVDFGGQDRAALLDGFAPDAIAFYSQATAERFFSVFGSEIAQPDRQSMIFACLSAQIAAAIPKDLPNRVLVAETKQETALFALLAEGG